MQKENLHFSYLRSEDFGFQFSPSVGCCKEYLIDKEGTYTSYIDSDPSLWHNQNSSKIYTEKMDHQRDPKK